MKELRDSLRIAVGKSHYVREVVDEVNRAIKSGWTIKGMSIDVASASDVYLDVSLGKTAGSRDFFKTGFSSTTKQKKVRKKKPLQCIDGDGPCTQEYAMRTGKNCSGCGG